MFCIQDGPRTAKLPPFSPFPGYFQALRCRPHGACQDLESPKMTEDKMRRILDSRNEHDSSEWDDGKNASEQEHFVLGGLEDARFLMRIVQNWLERGVDLLVLAAGFPCLVRLLGSPLGKHHVVVVIRHIAPRLARDETRLALRHGLHLFHETRDRWLETAAHHSLRQDTHRTRHTRSETVPDLGEMRPMSIQSRSEITSTASEISHGRPFSRLCFFYDAQSGRSFSKGDPVWIRQRKLAEVAALSRSTHGTTNGLLCQEVS
ncbi:hypothetical protein Ae201684_009715 [Aphanomyces euteiches]|uniref:Uncharacterized protein n=1 Tax=Aphanomyces euteiches TaxID=100861 RepID=A0A6G0X0V0_9STRA|nr:hypothetical protein Ae201684_009715 [Aphanomyces euteiches]